MLCVGKSNSCQLEGVQVVAGRAWFAVNTRPQCERIAITNLERQGFRTFLPLRDKTVRHARQFRRIVAPLFPGATRALRKVRRHGRRARLWVGRPVRKTSS